MFSDAAVCGENMRCGYSRCGVLIPVFDDLVDSIEKAPAKHMGGMAPMVQGALRQGQSRQGVTIPLFDELVRIYEASG